jgi:hypothetical protein
VSISGNTHSDDDRPRRRQAALDDAKEYIDAAADAASNGGDFEGEIESATKKLQIATGIHRDIQTRDITEIASGYVDNLSERGRGHGL